MEQRLLEFTVIDDISFCFENNSKLIIVCQLVPNMNICVTNNDIMTVYMTSPGHWLLSQLVFIPFLSIFQNSIL